MGQTGWRLPDDLLKRVRVHCAETGERQNEFVRQALEKALGTGSPGEDRTERPAPPRTPAMPKVVSGEVTFNETYTNPATLESAREDLKSRGYEQIQPRLGKGFVPPRPKGT